MPSVFTPPTVLDTPYVNPETPPLARRLLRHYGAIPRGRSVVKVSGVYQIYDTPDQLLLAELTPGTDYFLGGHVYVVTDAVAAALTTDGFGDYLTVPDVEFFTASATLTGMGDLTAAAMTGSAGAATLTGTGDLTATASFAPAPVPVWQSTQTANIASATSLTITKPVSTVSGDLLVAFVQINAGAATVTPPAEWTLIRQDAGGAGTAVNLNSYWLIAGGAEPADYTFNRSGTGGLVGSISRITGSHGSTPVDAHNGQYNASSTDAVAPAVTTTGTNRILVFACVAGGGAQTGVTPPAGMTERWEVLGDTARNHEGATEDFATAGGTGTRTATLSSAVANGAQLIAVRPPGA